MKCAGEQAFSEAARTAQKYILRAGIRHSINVSRLINIQIVLFPNFRKKSVSLPDKVVAASYLFSPSRMLYWQSNKIRPFSPNKVFLYFPPLPCLISILLICCLTLSTFAPDVSREAKGRRTSMKVPFTTVSLPTRGSLSMMLTTPARSWAVAHSPRSRVYSCTFFTSGT